MDALINAADVAKGDIHLDAVYLVPIFPLSPSAQHAIDAIIEAAVTTVTHGSGRALLPTPDVVLVDAHVERFDRRSGYSRRGDDVWRWRSSDDWMLSGVDNEPGPLGLGVPRALAAAMAVMDSSVDIVLFIADYVQLTPGALTVLGAGDGGLAPGVVVQGMVVDAHDRALVTSLEMMLAPYTAETFVRTARSGSESEDPELHGLVPLPLDSWGCSWDERHLTRLLATQLQAVGDPGRH